MIPKYTGAIIMVKASGKNMQLHKVTHKKLEAADQSLLYTLY